MSIEQLFDQIGQRAWRNDHNMRRPSVQRQLHTHRNTRRKEISGARLFRDLRLSCPRGVAQHGRRNDRRSKHAT